MNQTENQKISNLDKKNPYTLWFVVLAFVSPVVLAYIMFYFVEISSFTNNGEFIKPVVNVVGLKLTDSEGELIPPEILTFKWRMISFYGEKCNKKCQSRLHELHQIHRTLGKNQHRMLRMVVHLDIPDEHFKELINVEHSDLINTYGEKKYISSLLNNNRKLDEYDVYLMDPMGNIMMRFTSQQTAKEFQFDLRKLLKASQIG